MAATPRDLVERFYHEVWDNADEAVARDILHADFRFRGSLGSERSGRDGFIDYMRSIHAALADFRCVIDDLVENDRRVAARIRFTGIHRGPLLGVAATGRSITWSGAAFFVMDDCRITELWVLGDVDAVRRQLGAGSTTGKYDDTTKGAESCRKFTCTPSRDARRSRSGR